MELLSTLPRTTKKIAELLAHETLQHRLKLKSALVVGLAGNLGSGKTTFIQGFARGLGIRHRLTSPTFLIIRSYELGIRNYKKLYHVDAYRIKKPKELSALGFKEIIADPKNIVLIEWANKVKRLLPKKTLWIQFKHGKKENERLIGVSENL